MSFLINPYVYAGFDSDAQAFITAAGITDTTQKNAINTLVVDLKGYGIWTKMKAIYPFVGGTASTHKWNLKDPRDLDAAFRLLFYGGFTHSSNGIQGNSTNAYSDTRINASTVLNNNNLHLSFYSRINTTTENYSNEIMLGISYALSGNITLRTNNKNLGNAYFSGGDDSTEVVSASNTSLGFTIGTETSSSLRKFIKNNIILGTNTTTSTTGLRNANIVMWGYPSLNYSGNQCAFASIGDGLTDTEAANFYTAVQAYQTTLNRQIP